MLRELLSKFGNFFTGWRPVRIACITVEHQCAGFQRFFEFLLSERNRLVVVVRTYNFEIHAVAHEPPVACEIADLSRCRRDALPGIQSQILMFWQFAWACAISLINS